MHEAKTNKILNEHKKKIEEKRIDLADGEVKEVKVEVMDKPIHLEKYFHMEKYDKGIQGIMYSEFGRSEMHTREEWSILISSELKRDLK